MHCTCTNIAFAPSSPFLTDCVRRHIEKLMFAVLVKKFPSFQRVCTTDRQCYSVLNQWNHIPLSRFNIIPRNRVALGRRTLCTGFSCHLFITCSAHALVCGLITCDSFREDQPIVQTVHINVRKDVRIRGLRNWKGHTALRSFEMLERITKRCNVSQKNWILRMWISLYWSMGGAKITVCVPRDPLCTVYSTTTCEAILRDTHAPNMASHGTNYALDWSGWYNATRAWNFSACHEFLSDTGFSYGK